MKHVAVLHFDNKLQIVKVTSVHDCSLTRYTIQGYKILYIQATGYAIQDTGIQRYRDTSYSDTRIQGYVSCCKLVHLITFRTPFPEFSRVSYTFGEDFQNKQLNWSQTANKNGCLELFWNITRLFDSVQRSLLRVQA